MCRFADRPLPDGLLELLVATAQSAPSSSNLQAMSIVAVEDGASRARLAKLAAGQRHVADAPLLLMFVADLSRLREVSRDAGQPGEGLDYTEMFLVAVTGAAFAAQNVFTAMESLGLGGCYGTADPASIAAYDETMCGFRLDQLMSDIAWSRQAAGRVKDAGSLTGRHAIRDTLRDMGLGLK